MEQQFKCGNCTGSISACGCSRRADKLNTFDWLADLPDNAEATEMVEVQFKPPRKGYYLNVNKIPPVGGGRTGRLPGRAPLRLQAV